ncbi:MAG: crossover junction endodeoxyribonuclease RuvC [Candidatus Aenigmatarchaeota archaeon]
MIVGIDPGKNIITFVSFPNIEVVFICHKDAKISKRFFKKVVNVNFYSSIRDLHLACSKVVNEFLDRSRDCKFAIEGYSYQSPGHLVEIAEVVSILKLVFEEKGCEYMTIPPSRAKKILTGKGTATKSEVAIAVYKKLGIDFSHFGKEMEHCYDALAIAYSASIETNKR